MIAYDDNEDVMKRKMKAGSFNAMDLDKLLMQGLTRMQYKIPTPVQRKTLPMALAGMDAVCMARTGSGKTAAFLIPMFQRFPTHDSTAGIRGIVLSPTRELAVQTFRFAKDMSKFTDLRVVSIIGGDPLEPQFEALSNRPDMLIATPGRLMHHLSEISTFTLKSVKYLVFDEADRLFEMGFAEQLNSIIKQCPEDRQTLLFSATMPKQLIQFTRAGLRDPQLIRLESDNKMSDELRMAFFCVRSNEKMAALLYLVRTIIPATDMTIVFTATRHHSEYVHSLFKEIGVTSTIVYGTMDQEMRTSNLKDFRNGKISYLIVTDLAARGIDVPLLNNVINLHFPTAPKMFVHRCGRAARQGRIGYAFSLVEPEEMAYLADVHTFLGHPISNSYDRAVATDAVVELQVGDASSSQIGNGNSKGNAGGTSLVPRTAHSRGYTLEEFVPEFVHTGILPQDVLNDENDYLRRLLGDEEEFRTMARIADNGMMQYRRTRSSASDKGVSAAKALVKSNSIVAIHPLICGVDPDHCNEQLVEKANYIRMLQTFRPAQTVLESGVGTGTTGSQAVKGKGKKSHNSSAGGAVESNGVSIMQALRKTTDLVLERNKERKKQLYDTFMAEQAAQQFHERDDDEAVSKTATQAGSSKVSDEALSSNKKGKKGTGGGGTPGSDVWAQLEAISAMEEGDAADTKGGKKGRGKKSRTETVDQVSVDEHDEVDEFLPPASTKRVMSAPVAYEEEPVKARLSISERKKLKKQGKTSEEISHIARQKMESGSAMGDEGAGPGESASRNTDGYMPGSNSYADNRFYMAYGVEDQTVSYSEEALQPNSGLKTAEAQHAAMMEAAMLDVAPDDAMNMAKARRIMRWDAKKRKYVKQSMDEIANLKGGKKARSEGTSGGQSKSAKPVGDMYKAWAKKTHREVNTFKVMADIGSDTIGSRDDGLPVPKFKHNLDVPSELKNEEQIRKKNKEVDNAKMKNLPKEKRRGMEAAMRKKKGAAKKAEVVKGKMVHKAARKSLKAIQR